MNNEDLQRKCPGCGKILEYSNKWERNRANKKNKICCSCRTKKLLQDPEHILKIKRGVQQFQLDNPLKRKWSEEVKQKIRKNAKRLYGKDNLSYGKSNYKWWIEKYGIDIANKKMLDLSKKRSANVMGVKNPMYGKPSPQGSGNGWSGWYNGWYFRSIHELSYMINVIEKNKWKWESGEQKKFAIPYVDWNGKIRNYFADFIIDGTLMVECKPTRLHKSSGVKSKQEGAIKFCVEKGLTYRIECPILLSKHELKTLHDTGTMKFLKKYEDKYQLLHNG